MSIIYPKLLVPHFNNLFFLLKIIITTNAQYTSTVTPSIGQYCSVYINGFTTAYPEIQKCDSTYSCTYTTDCSQPGACVYALACNSAERNICKDQSKPMCPWNLGPNCGSPPLTTCYPFCSKCITSNTQAYSYCNPGCAAVANCTSIPNSVFTGAAVPQTNINGCPFQCNNGYYPNAGSCSQCMNPPANAIYIGPGTNWGNCPWTCNTGYYSSVSLCVACTNKPTYADYTGNSVSGSNCPWVCYAGYYAFTTKCFPCPAGTYSTRGQTTCTPCPSGTYQDTTGSSTCKTCQLCSEGYYKSGCGGADPGACQFCTN